MVLRLLNIYKSYPSGEGTLEVLKDFSLEVAAGEVVALVGPSGCGKTTLLQIAGLLDHPDAGQIRIGRDDAGNIPEAERTELRLKHLGFIYQFHHLLPEFSALEHVMLPMLIAGSKKNDAESRARALLDNFKLLKRQHHRPSQLSGGEQQRVAIARALANHPKLLLADEPTGNLDPATASIVFDQFIEYARKSRLSVLLVTHNPEIAERADRRVNLGV